MTTRVLLLEEDPIVGADVQRRLREIGCDVTLLRNGAVGLARAMSERFDVVVLSAELAGMNGFRVCNRIKKDELTRRVPVLLTAGDSADGFAQHQALATRADAYLRKPFVVGELVARMRLLVPALDRRSVPGFEAAREIESTPRLDSEPTIRHASPVAAIADELAAAHEELGALKRLRTQLTESEQGNAALRAEVARLKSAEARRSLPPGGVPSTPPVGPTAARELLAQREALHKKEREATALRAELETAKHASASVRQKLEAVESSGRAADLALREREAEVARLEKLLASARGDKEQAAKRAHDQARRADRSKPEIDELRAELAQERAWRGAAEATFREARDRERAAAEEALAEALALRDRVHEEQQQTRDRAEAQAAARRDLSARATAELEERARALAVAEEAQAARRDELASELARVESAHAETLSFLAHRAEEERARALAAMDAAAAAKEALARAREEASRALDGSERARTAEQETRTAVERALAQANEELTALRAAAAGPTLAEQHARADADRAELERIAQAARAELEAARIEARDAAAKAQEAEDARDRDRIEHEWALDVARTEHAEEIAREREVEQRHAALVRVRALEERVAEVERESAAALRAAEQSLAGEREARATAEQRLAEEREGRTADAAAHAQAVSDAAARYAEDGEWAWSEALQAVEVRERNHKEETHNLRAQHEAALADLQQRATADAARAERLAAQDEASRREIEGLVRRVAELQSALSAATLEEVRARDDAGRTHDATIMDLQRELDRVRAERDDQVTEMRRAFTRQLQEAEEAIAEAGAARDTLRAEAEADRDTSVAELTSRITAQLTGEHERELAAQRANVTTALAAVREQYERARAALEQRADTSADQAARLEAELRDRVAREALAAAHVQSLEALVATRTEEQQQLRARLEEAQVEVPELEAEIVGLRSELMSARRQLHQEVIAHKDDPSSRQDS